MRKVLISVAPVSAADKHINPEKIAEDVIACRKAGAGMVHLHVRDKNGSLTDDLTVFKQTVEPIVSATDLVIQASTGGVSNLTIEQRCAPLYYDRVETASLNVGSVNLGDSVYSNPIQDVRYCVSEIQRKGILPEIEVFEIGMIQTVLELNQEKKFRDPLLFNIVLGHKGAAPATVEALCALRSFIPDGVMWGVTHFGRKDSSIFSAAIAMGASTLRVGFEDSNYLDANTQVENNAPLVEYAAKIIRGLNCEVAAPQDAREMFQLSEPHR